jgi:diguanylate cyclase (GGDEF)-like protein
MLKSKIHRATVTGCDPDYAGSITRDPELMAQADLLVNTVARIGGDEFFVICEEAEGAPEALDTARRIHEALTSPFEIGDLEGRITISIGVSSLARRRLPNAEQLVEEADEAMYEAKRRGPGGDALYEPGE